MSGSTGSDLDLLADDTEDALRESLRRLLASRATPERISACYDGDDSVGADVWAGLVELGLTGLLVSERHGGAEATAREAAAVLDELGRVCAPAPYLSSAVIATAVLRNLDAGGPPMGPLLEELAGGLVAALVVPATTHRRDDVELLDLADDGTVTGEVRSVLGVCGGAPAEVLLVPVRSSSGAGLAVVRLPDPGCTSRQSSRST